MKLSKWIMKFRRNSASAAWVEECIPRFFNVKLDWSNTFFISSAGHKTFTLILSLWVLTEISGPCYH